MRHVAKASDFFASGVAQADAPDGVRRATMTAKCMLIGATAIAIALTSFDARTALASDNPVVRQNLTDVGAARRARGGDPAIPLAAFGALAGAIAGIAAAERERAYYGPFYDSPAALQYGRPMYRRHHGYYGVQAPALQPPPLHPEPAPGAL
jgi:hypothetical protein